MACIIIIPATLLCCNSKQVETKAKNDSLTATTTASVKDSSGSSTSDIGTTDNVTLYFTIADTGQNYFALREKMFVLNKALNIPIDTMNRYYNREKNEIILSENDEDDMYRGEYFPRRFPSQNLSLEYYHTYIDNSTQKNIALVTGIYETRKSADSALTILRPYAVHAFVVKAIVYEGCVH